MTNFSRNWLVSGEARSVSRPLSRRRRLRSPLPRFLQRQLKHKRPVDGDLYQYPLRVTIDRVVNVVGACEKRLLFLIARDLSGPPFYGYRNESTIDFSRARNYPTRNYTPRISSLQGSHRSDSGRCWRSDETINEGLGVYP